MAKRDVWVGIDGVLVRGDHVVGVSVGETYRSFQAINLWVKATGHRDPLALNTGITRGSKDEASDNHQQAIELAEAFVDTLARAAALPNGALLRLEAEDHTAQAHWTLTALGQPDALESQLPG